MNNNALVIYKHSILFFNGIVEIHHAGLIWKAEQYDRIELFVMNYLHFEGFLETIDLEHPENCGDMIHVAEIKIFDGTGNQVTREQLI